MNLMLFMAEIDINRLLTTVLLGEVMRGVMLGVDYQGVRFVVILLFRIS